ncbi:MAG: VCBS repeat-containing protein [Phaeodactylibacter sp.]|nr:VCBS repeat-containing protein [Phaeodactylibacter sp.]
MLKRGYLIIGICMALAFVSCQKQKVEDTSTLPLFSILKSENTGIAFVNDVKETLQLNALFHDYYYNGAGLAVGDVNGDGLPDIYFVSNLDTNRLYLNLGHLKFKDVTAEANVWGGLGYHTGTTMVDINADGLLDIYVCKSGAFGADLTRNVLYVNQGVNENSIPSFKEEGAKYNLDVLYTTTQAAFFDYDKDGDLDVFFSNYGLKPYTDQDLEMFSQTWAELWGDRLYRNDDAHFTDVSEQAGMKNSLLGDGLGVGIGDVNNDGWADIYLCNDFSERDFLYLNNQDGTFSEVAKEATNHISNYAMGNDIADVNNDGWLDIVALDMVSEDNYGIKTSMSAMNPGLFQLHVNLGLHHQYMFNSLQLNNGNAEGNLYPYFSEIGQLAGISSTDWSWAPLLIDMDNDGYRDLFVSNGIKRDFRNNDFLAYKKQRMAQMEAQMQGRENPQLLGQYIKDVLEKMPQRPKRNYFFRNQGNLQFANVSETWAAGDWENVATGAAYADLDGDGDMDIVANMTGEPAVIYENNTSNLTQHHYLQIKLEGTAQNPLGIGTRVALKYDGQIQLHEMQLSRGYQSSVEPLLHFGLGIQKMVDTLIVIWPDGKEQLLPSVRADQRVTLKYADAGNTKTQRATSRPFLKNSTKAARLHHRHIENSYDDFEKEVLLPHKMSEFGPALAIADANGDGLDDFYIGGAMGYEGALYFQREDGTFEKQPASFTEADKKYEDVGALFLDVEGDGDQDLYVVSGGNEYPALHLDYQDRLYLNDGLGQFSATAIPYISSSGGKVVAADYDQDGKTDLFVAGRLIPQQYPLPASSLILKNLSTRDKAVFKNITTDILPDLNNIGLVTDANWADVTGDGKLDLILVGEWMPVTIFEQKDGKFERLETESLANTQGWWSSLQTGDFDQDGDLDLIAGNLGLNYKYKASVEAPFEVYATDFDKNGSQDIALGYYNGGNLYPLRGRQCSAQQVPQIKEKFPTYDAFGKATLKQVYGDMGLEEAMHYTAKTFASTYFENKGGGDFEVRVLPAMAQLSSINVIEITDLNDDGFSDVIVAGNLYQSEVETPRNDAGYGLVLINDKAGFFKVLPPFQSGLYLKGDVKSGAAIQLARTRKAWLFARNNDFVELIEKY